MLEIFLIGIAIYFTLMALNLRSDICLTLVNNSITFAIWLKNCNTQNVFGAVTIACLKLADYRSFIRGGEYCVLFFTLVLVLVLALINCLRCILLKGVWLASIVSLVRYL